MTDMISPAAVKARENARSKKDGRFGEQVHDVGAPVDVGQAGSPAGPVSSHPELYERSAHTFAEIQAWPIPDPADSKIIALGVSEEGYMGGNKFTGGRRQGYTGQKQVADNIRAAVKNAVKTGEIPPDLSYSVQMQRGMSSIDILVGNKQGGDGKAVPADDDLFYRPASQEAAIAGSAADHKSLYFAELWDTAPQPVATEFHKKLFDYLKELGNQWGSHDNNDMVDYFNSYCEARVRLRREFD